MEDIKKQEIIHFIVSQAFLKMKQKSPMKNMKNLKGDDGKPTYIQKLCDPSIEYRLQERMYLHRNTDDDFAKYSRNIRLGIDVEYSQSALNYIDQYNQQVSETVNQEGFPQEVVYPEYKLPEKPINT